MKRIMCLLVTAIFFMGIILQPVLVQAEQKTVTLTMNFPRKAPDDIHLFITIMGTGLMDNYETIAEKGSISASIKITANFKDKVILSVNGCFANEDEMDDLYSDFADFSEGDLMLEIPFPETAKDIDPPDMPSVEDLGDKDTKITGYSEAGSTIAVKIGDSVIGTGTTGKDGTFEVQIPAQKVGTQLLLTSTDAAGNESYPAEIIVKNSAPPQKPVVDSVADNDGKVTGTAEPGSIITVSAGNDSIGTAKTGDDKKFSVDIPRQKAGITLNIIATDAAGNKSNAVTVLVVDKTPPLPPKVNDVYNNSKVVTGKAEAGSTVTVKKSGKTVGTAVAGNAGAFSISIPVQKVGTILLITAKDKAGNQGGVTKVTVKLKKK